MRLILANEATAAKRRVYFHIVDATDGITAEVGEAAGQPQVSSDGAAFTNTGIGTLSHLGNGRYSADLTQTVVATAGTQIETRYKSGNTAECPGDSVQVVAFDPYSTSLGLLLAAANLSSDTITAAKIATDAITAAKIATGAITAAKFAAGAIDAAAIATDAITAAKIAADAIGASELAADAVTEIQSGLATSSALTTAQADLDDIQTRLPAALVSGRMDSSVGAMAANVITAAATAADAGTELAAAVDATLTAAHGAGSWAGGSSAIVTGTADSGTTTTMVDAARTEADTDYWKGAWIYFTSGTIVGQVRLITGFNAATDTITFAPATTQTVGTQTYEILANAGVDVELWKNSVPSNLISGRVDSDIGAISTDSAAADALETMLDGTGGNVLTLSQLRINSTAAGGAVDIDNTSGPAISARTSSGVASESVSTGGNGTGIVATGQGSGRGMLITPGATGTGLDILGGSSGGGAIRAVVPVQGIGLEFTGGGTGSGVEITGGATNGNALTCQARGGGSGIVASADTTGNGIWAVGGTTSGDGINASADGNGQGINAAGTGTGAGILATADANGHGIRALGGTVTGDGFHAEARGVGDGIEAIGAGGGFDINADIQGSLSGSVASVTGNVGGNVVGTVASVVGNVGGNVNGNVVGTVASVVGNVGGNVNGNLGGTLSAAALAQINTEADTALADIRLDELIQNASSGLPTQDAFLDLIMSKDAGQSFTRGDDSLEAIRDALAAAGPTASVIADAVWDEARAGHVGAGSFGEGVASVQGNVTGSVASVTGAVGSVAAGGITAASIATDAIDSDAIAASAVTEIQANLATSASIVTLQADTDDIQARLPATLSGGRMRSQVEGMDAGTVTAAAIATGAVDADALAADAGTEIAAAVDVTLSASHGAGAWGGGGAPTVAQIADGVWDELIAGHAIVGSTGEALTNAAAGGAGLTAQQVANSLNLAPVGAAAAGSVNETLASIETCACAGGNDEVNVEGI